MPVMGTDGHVVVSPDGAVLAWTFRYDSLGRPDTGNWQRGRWYVHLPPSRRHRAGRRLELGGSADLMTALQDQLLRRMLNRPDGMRHSRGADHPPPTAVRWGTAEVLDVTPEPSAVRREPSPAPAAGLPTVPGAQPQLPPPIISGITGLTPRPGAPPGQLIDMVRGLYFTASPQYSTSQDEAARRSVTPPDRWVVIAGHGDRYGLRSGEIQLTPDQVARLTAIQNMVTDAEGIVLAMCEA